MEALGGRPMARARLSRSFAVMQTFLMTALANERAYELRAAAAKWRRGRIASQRTRRASARRTRVPFRVA